MNPVVYMLPLSPFGHRVKIAARVKGCEDQIDFVTRPEGDAYLEITPFGKVPAMVDDGFVITESLSICEYIDAKYDGPSLAASDPKDIAIISMLARLMEFYAGAGLGKLFQMGPQGDPAAIEAAFAELNKGLGFLDMLISDGEFAHGDHFSMADIVLAPTLYFVPTLCGMHGRGAFETAPKTAAYTQKIAAHPAVAPSVEEMGAAMRAMMSGG